MTTERDPSLPDVPPGRVDPAWGMAAFIDVETTGLDHREHEVIELAMVLFAFNRDDCQIIGILDEYEGLREPSRSIPRDATEVHGITKRMVKGKELDRGRVSEIMGRAELLIAHNAAFDLPFVAALFPEAVKKPWYCSMEGVDWVGLGFRGRSLHRLLEDHEIRTTVRHRGAADVKAGIVLLGLEDDEGSTYFARLLQSGPVPVRVIRQKAPGCGCSTLVWVPLVVVIALAFLVARAAW